MKELQNLERSKRWAILNAAVLIALVLWNYAVNANGINGKNIASLSDEYYNLFTPASYAFGIWGVIYLALFGMVTFWVREAYRESPHRIHIVKAGPCILTANVLNGLWIYLWLTENTGLSVLVMIAILSFLLRAVKSLDMCIWPAPKEVIGAIWWPISLYAGWITVALVANISAYLAKEQVEVLFTEVVWTRIVIAISFIIYLMVVFKRNMRVFGLVGVWAFIAIAVRHWIDYPTLSYTALAAGFMLFLAIFSNRMFNTDALLRRPGL